MIERLEDPGGDPDPAPAGGGEAAPAVAGEDARPAGLPSWLSRRPAGGGSAEVPPPVCVFDLDHTLVSSPLDLRRVTVEMEAFLRGRGLALPSRELPWSAPELLALVRREAPGLEPETLAIPLLHERHAMEQASLEPFALEAVAALKRLGFALALWTNNARAVADFVLERFGLGVHLDLVVTRDDVAELKPHPDGLRLVRARWPEAEHIVVVGDSWVDGVAAQAGGVPFVAYRSNHAELERRGVAVAAAISSLLDLPAALA